MLRGMWDSVVSMMKTAVDALLFDDDSVEVGVDVSAPEPPAKVLLYCCELGPFEHSFLSLSSKDG